MVLTCRNSCRGRPFAALMLLVGNYSYGEYAFTLGCGVLNRYDSCAVYTCRLRNKFTAGVRTCYNNYVCIRGLEGCIINLNLVVKIFEVENKTTYINLVNLIGIYLQILCFCNVYLRHCEICQVSYCCVLMRVCRILESDFVSTLVNR